ncbi:threonine--tRNA ligase [Cytobacillus firmus]|uniref:threonine--tRNA ligase n=1 Tax=Cytobacillus firmus TaxID=1399 RepID=UPI00077C5C88|nr:threonine--tRNA ligase [Cytobacillus firmus]MEC1892398.1 threonine--tRNA ligase [Cytobacillus firmus]MED4447632.1 threonine--tRNA ligase [Cytobacillus firmus]MED4767478.1 threonine--tRNA ligase [Cytobacillus firmus]SUV00722.1 threonyl-tRNA synthetase [Cytobacillus firmus]
MEAEKINHRKLGQELELFTSMEEAPGMPFFLPKGMVMRNELESYWRKKHQRAGYQEIKTPIMMKQELWEQSGHWDHYHENMYFSNVDEQNYAIKPMNCPGAILIFNSKRRSYRELPIRYAELGLVHRHELSGSLNGLLRVRSFTQDDAHLFVRADQIEAEIDKILVLIDEFYSHFGFDYKVELSTRPEEYMGSQEMWERAEGALESVLKNKEVNYQINPGDGAFYGPKIDFHILDSLGRSWQCGTVQLDFQMPQKFNCSYVGEDNKLHLPIMIHRAIFGSVERFMAILIEHFAGDFPLWLSPVQAKIIPISDAHAEYADFVKSQLESAGIRAEVDFRTEKMGLKIREAEKQKIPYMLVIGDKEMEQQSLALRKRKEGNIGVMSIEEVIERFVNELNGGR